MIGKWFDKLVFMVLENHGWSQVQSCKFINYFQQNGTTFMNWEGATHPSGPNYRALLSGNVWSTNEFDSVQRPNVAAQVPYTVYSYANDPAQRHNPFLDMNPKTFSGCVQLGQSKQFTLDANITYLGMDDQNDAHSGPLEIADQHVIDACNQFQQLCHTSIYAPLRLLMFVTFDEAFGLEYLTNHVFTGVLTHNISMRQTITQKLSHYNFAATLAENWNIDLPEMNPLGNSAIKPFYLNI